MAESQQAHDAYQGYSSKTVIQNHGNLDDYFFFESEYAFRFHFDRQDDWGGSVVDFGGRLGEKTRKVNNVTVAEIDSAALDWMRKHGIRCAASLSNFPSGSLDTIYCSHVLEHLENYSDYLNLFREKLKKHGHLILVVPADQQTFEPRWFQVCGDAHLNTWNVSAITNAVARHGFKVEKVRINAALLNYLSYRFLYYRLLGNNRMRQVYLDSAYWMSENRLGRFSLFFFPSLFVFTINAFASLFGVRGGKLPSPSVGEILIVATKE